MSASNSGTNQFLRIDLQILESRKLTSNQKLIVSYILSWQNAGKECYFTNDMFSHKLGMPLTTFTDALSALRKLDFFNVQTSRSLNEFGKWSNRRIVTISDPQLRSFLQDLPNNRVTTELQKEVAVPIQPSQPSESKLSKASVFEFLSDLYCDKILSNVDSLTTVEEAATQLRFAVHESVLVSDANKPELGDWVTIFQREELPKLLELTLTATA